MLSDDVAAVDVASREIERKSAAAGDSYLPCAAPAKNGRGFCGRRAMPGSVHCRHCSPPAEIISRAAAEVRMECARGLVHQELAEGVLKAVNLYLTIIEDTGSRDADRLAAADRVIALAGGKDLLVANAEEGEESGAVGRLRELLTGADDERLDRLAARLGVGRESLPAAPEAAE